MQATPEAYQAVTASLIGGPEPNAPGAHLVEMRACRAATEGCPNSLIDAALWQAAISNWLAEADISERLRMRVETPMVMAHDKLRITVAGCPNACSRPQIADLAVVGRIRPHFDESACAACGDCVAQCPDQAIVVGESLTWFSGRCQGCLGCSSVCDYDAVNLSAPWGQVLMGGKLGRSPQLARPAAEVADPWELIPFFSQAVESYLENAPLGIRFAAWWAVRREGGVL